MTPEFSLANQAARHMPIHENQGSRQVEREHAGRLWVEMGVRTVFKPDGADYEEPFPMTLRPVAECDDMVRRKLAEGFITKAVARAIIESFTIIICAASILRCEVAGHGAAGELRTARFHSTRTEVEAHETPGGELFRLSIYPTSNEGAKMDRPILFAAVRKDTVETPQPGAARDTPG